MSACSRDVRSGKSWPSVMQAPFSAVRPDVRANFARLLPSADDESDVSSLTVTEKQIGVKFEGVRKVYHTEQGDVVAVEDFTLKLCEGEVTSLLGRNGAGKTTIMYVSKFPPRETLRVCYVFIPAR